MFSVSPIDKQIIKELWGWIGIGLLGLGLLFLVGLCPRLIPLLLNVYLGFKGVVRLLWVLWLPVMAFGLTPILGVALLAVAGRMGADGELLALDGAGISRFRLARPAAVSILVLFGVSVWLYGIGVPTGLTFGVNQLRQRRVSALVSGLPTGRFIRLDEKTIFFADRRVNGQYRHIFMELEMNGSHIMFFAERAGVTPGASSDKATIRLSGGSVLLLDGVEYQGLFSIGPTVARFDKMTILLANRDTSFQLPLDQQMHRTTSSLWQRGDGAACFERHRRVARPLELLLFGGLCLMVAFGRTWRHWARGVGAAGSMFVVLFVLVRTGEFLGQVKGIAPAITPYFGAMGLMIALILFSVRQSICADWWFCVQPNRGTAVPLHWDCGADAPHNEE